MIRAVLRGRPDCSLDSKCSRLPSPLKSIIYPDFQIHCKQNMFRLNNRTSKKLNPALNQDEKENRTPTLHDEKTVLANHALTLPRLERSHNAPVEVNENQMTPCFLASTSRSQSRSAPGPKAALANITNTIDRVVLRHSPEDLTELLHGIVRSGESPSIKENSPVRERKKIKSEPSWTFTNDSDGVKSIVKVLKLEIPTLPNNPVELFHYLENRGQLDSMVLKLFSKCPDINTIDMAPTYAGKINEIGLLEASLLPAKKCTMPLFQGFAEVKVIDFTNVHLTDDDLRFLIRLRNLQALGLSGTKITNKGLKYLAMHSTFKENLQCLKLCYVTDITGAGLEHFCSAFKHLSEIDLWGCSQLKFEDCFCFKNHKLSKLRLPADLHNLIEERHLYYREHPKVILQVGELQDLSDDQLRIQLKLHRKHFSDIFLALSRSDLVKRLGKIIEVLQLNEILYHLI